MTTPDVPRVVPQSRRQFFQRVGGGLGPIALSLLLRRDLQASEPSSPDVGARTDRDSTSASIPTRARNVIFFHLVGAPSHLDLFDPKPELVRRDGEPVPESLIAGQRFAFLRGHPTLLGSRYRFRQHGSSGLALSELLPHLGMVVDEIAMLKALRTEEFNHAPAQLFLQTGFGQFGRPSLGSWLSYGLGSLSEDLPRFVVLQTGATAGAGNSLWGSGFLPSIHQGVEFRSVGDPVLFLSNPSGVTPADRRRMLDRLGRMNQIQLADVGDPEIATRIAQYEMAYRMQTSVPELMSLESEPQRVRDEYGAEPGQARFANHCLLARRLVERGVRFVQVLDSGWDHHGGLFRNLPRKVEQVDRPIAALIRDLKRRGLLDQTLIVWAAEFGRTPMLQGQGGASAGRDHHKDAYAVWLAGGGVRGGTTFGRTDELGYHAVEGSTHIHDLHATILHLLGLDHTRLTFTYQGRPFRLTDVAGEVVEPILA